MRLAERQGLLTGRQISEVQSFALEMLMLLDHKEDARRFVQDLRARLAAAHPQSFRGLFPDWFSDDPEEQDSANTDSTPDIDDPNIVWSVPESEQERQELDRWINQHSTGTITASELEGGGWV